MNNSIIKSSNKKTRSTVNDGIYIESNNNSNADSNGGNFLFNSYINPSGAKDVSIYYTRI